MNKIFLIITALIIVSLSIGSIAAPDKEFSEEENRTLAAAPSFSVSTLLNGDLAGQFENYAADQFPFRNKWVAFKAAFERLSGKKENNGVYFAKDGYLIETPDGLSVDTAKNNAASITKMAAKGYNSTLLLIPTAFEILDEKLPKYAYTDIQKKISSAVQGELKNVNYIYPDDALKKHAEEYIYYRTDHHQTTLGSYYSYLEYCRTADINPVSYKGKIISNEFYGTTWSKAMLSDIMPDTLSVNDAPLPEMTVTFNDKETTDTIYNYDKLNTKDKYAFFLGGNYGTVKIETNLNTQKSICIVKDSYANAILPFLVNHYDKILLVDMRYCNTSVTKLLEDNNISDILYIYNATNFAKDQNLIKLTI